jgi:formamidopyrimidine-DNA glycosylase
MSIEMPEATILAQQMAAELTGRSIAGFELRGCDSLQRMGFVNKDTGAFERLVGETVVEVASRGNTVVVKLTGGQNLIVAPEYGGEVFFREDEHDLPARFNLRLDLTDGSVLTVRLTSMGCIYASAEDELAGQYMIQRDFDSGRPEPTDPELALDMFSDLLERAGRQLKPVLVGKDAIVVGLSNSAFQDIIYRAGLHPKRRSSGLTVTERRALYEAMRLVTSERLRLGGKAGFRDLYGRPGGYEPAMGPVMKGRSCPACGSAVQKLALGGGDVFICPQCQPAPA